MLATGEPVLVAAAAAAVAAVVRHNAAVLPRLYTTGAFFLVLAYCGSNLVEVASLLRVRSRCCSDCWRNLTCCFHSPTVWNPCACLQIHRAVAAFAAADTDRAAIHRTSQPLGCWWWLMGFAQVFITTAAT